MKNLIIIFLLLPVFSFAQYGLKDCHTDLVLGYDYGEYFFSENEKPTQNLSSINSFRVGTNITYPIRERLFMVSGIRVVSKIETHERTSFSEIPTEGIINISRKSQNYYAEIPFNFRYLVKSIGRDSRLYVEGGLQFNFFVFSFVKKEGYNEKGVTVEEKMLERDGRVPDFNLSTQFAIGWEYDFSEKMKYFIQPIGRYQLLAPRRDFPFLSYHVGLETGIRF